MNCLFIIFANCFFFHKLFSSSHIQISIREARLHYKQAYDTTGLAVPLTARHTHVQGCTLTIATGISAMEKSFVSIAPQDLVRYELVTTLDFITRQLLGTGG